MATFPIPERAIVRRTYNPPPHAEQELFLAIRAPQTPIQGRWLLEVVKLLLHKLPPAQTPLPGILPQFNPGPPLQSLLSSPAPPGIIPQRRIIPVEERYLRTSPTHEAFDFRAPQPPPTFGPIYERYNRRLADLKNLLGPLTRENDGSGDDDSGCVLLCWGGSSSCRVLAVNHIGGSIDQELFWKKLQTAWYDTRGRWRQKLPWYRIRSVKQVEIRLVGPDPNAKDLFHGVYQPADKALETKEQRLRENASTFSDYPEPERDLYDDYGDHEFDPCRYDFRKGFTIHQRDDDGLATCGVEFPDITCPVEEFYENQKRLTRLKMEPLRTLLFQNPKMAVYNELENTELVYSSK
jgi:hypothetical protein